jgi:predicted lipoprotein with Yx(FWY)xxD motif
MHHMTRSAITIVATLATAMAVTACGSSSPKAAGTVAPVKTAATPSSPATPTSSTPAAQPSGTDVGVISTHHTQDGSLIAGIDGRTLYYFQPDKSASAGAAKSSTCYKACATVWPPVLATATPSASGSAKASLIALTKRTDGTMQVTYNGLPLYYYAADLKAGQVTGNHLRDGFGFWGALLASGHDTPSS